MFPGNQIHTLGVGLWNCTTKFFGLSRILERPRIQNRTRSGMMSFSPGRFWLWGSPDVTCQRVGVCRVGEAFTQHALYLQRRLRGSRLLVHWGQAIGMHKKHLVVMNGVTSWWFQNMSYIYNIYYKLYIYIYTMYVYIIYIYILYYTYSEHVMTIYDSWLMTFWPCCGFSISILPNGTGPQ